MDFGMAGPMKIFKNASMLFPINVSGNGAA